MRFVNPPSIIMFVPVVNFAHSLERKTTWRKHAQLIPMNQAGFVGACFHKLQGIDSLFSPMNLRVPGLGPVIQS